MATESEKVFLPINPPATTHKDDPRATLTQPEQDMYDEVLAHFTKEDPTYNLPNIEKGELRDEEKFWLSRECLLRFLRASKWKTTTAITRLENTLKWRREFGIYDTVNAAYVEPEATTGKEIVFGYDVKGRPAFYMIPSRQNTDEAKRQIEFAFWMLERCIDLMEPGVENIALLINFGDRAKNPSMSTARAVLNILQEHYPERLGLALIINVPFLVNAFFKIIMPFVDPVTREKVKFNPQVLSEGIFTPDMIMKQWWDGEKDFEYVHDKYWPGLVALCEERQKTWMTNWRKLGAKVGLSEWAYKTRSSEPEPHAVDKEKVEAEISVGPTPQAPIYIAPKETVDSVSIPEKSTKQSNPPAVAGDKKDDAAQAQTGGTTSGGAHSTAAVTGAGAVAGGDGTGGGGGGGDGGGDGGGE